MAQQLNFSIDIKPRSTDQFLGTGIVFASAYLDWLVDVYDPYLEKLGLEPPQNTMPAPLRYELTFHGPLLISEEAKLSVRTARIGRFSVTAEFQITEAKTGRPVTTIIGTTVWVDAQTGHSVPLPDEWKQKVIAFEGKENVEVAAK